MRTRRINPLRQGGTAEHVGGATLTVIDSTGGICRLATCRPALKAKA
jgi:hypothetical protein